MTVDLVPVVRHRENDLKANPWVKQLLPTINPNVTRTSDASSCPWVPSSVSGYVQMGVSSTSAKSTQYVEILWQRCKQTSRIPGVNVLNSSVERNAWRQQHSSAWKVGTIRRTVAKSYDNMLSRLQREVGQTQLSDLCGD